MRIKFDPSKDKLNRAQHACRLPLQGNPLAAFVDRGEVRRIISLRYAQCREVKRYVENNS